MSNSMNMTLEQRIVQTIKDDTLMKLVGDEDAITELVNRAIREALFQSYKTQSGYGGSYTEKPSRIVEAAQEIGKKFAEKVAQQLFDELMADPEKKRLVLDAMISMIPNAINNYMDYTMKNLMQQSSIDAMHQLKETLRSDPSYLTR